MRDYLAIVGQSKLSNQIPGPGYGLAVVPCLPNPGRFPVRVSLYNSDGSAVGNVKIYDSRPIYVEKPFVFAVVDMTDVPDSSFALPSTYAGLAGAAFRVYVFETPAEGFGPVFKTNPNRVVIYQNSAHVKAGPVFDIANQRGPYSSFYSIPEWGNGQATIGHIICIPGIFDNISIAFWASAGGTATVTLYESALDNALFRYDSGDVFSVADFPKITSRNVYGGSFIALEPDAGNVDVLITGTLKY